LGLRKPGCGFDFFIWPDIWPAVGCAGGYRVYARSSLFEHLMLSPDYLGNPWRMGKTENVV
jgi:hypothetical protein